MHEATTPTPSSSRSLRRKLPLIVAPLVALLLSACASTTPGGRTQLTVPQAISSLHSSFDLSMTLSSLAPVATPCAGMQCQVDKGFERQVARLGARLATSAHAAYPELKERVPEFTFTVAEKADGGSSSDASGNIVIYRGVRQSRLDEESLAYLMAREMGHVIARHHEEKSAAGLVSAVLAHVLLAPVNMARAAAFLASSTVSAFGKEWMVAGDTPAREREADAIALALLARQGWTDSDVAESLSDYSARLDSGAWSTTIKHMTVRLSAAIPTASPSRGSEQSG